jgi:hypothetical protein
MRSAVTLYHIPGRIKTPAASNGEYAPSPFLYAQQRVSNDNMKKLARFLLKYIDEAADAYMLLKLQSLFIKKPPLSGCGCKRIMVQP